MFLKVEVAGVPDSEWWGYTVGPLGRMVPGQCEAGEAAEQNWVGIHMLPGAQPGTCIAGCIAGDLESYFVSWGLSLFLSLSLRRANTHFPSNQVEQLLPFCSIRFFINTKGMLYKYL